MGVIVGEWVFPDRSAPGLDEIADALRARTGLTVDCTHNSDGQLDYLDMPLIKESLFEWQRQEDRIQVHSFVPAHPYLWLQLDAVMHGFGGRISDSTIAWRPETPTPALDRPWSELTRRQRFILRLPSVFAARPLDFLAQREN